MVYASWFATIFMMVCVTNIFAMFFLAEIRFCILSCASLRYCNISSSLMALVPSALELFLEIVRAAVMMASVRLNGSPLKILPLPTAPRLGSWDSFHLTHPGEPGIHPPPGLFRNNRLAVWVSSKSFP